MIYLRSSGIRASMLTTAIRNLKKALFLQGASQAEALWSTKFNQFLALVSSGCRLSAVEEREIIKQRIARKPDAILSGTQQWLEAHLWSTPWGTDAGMDARGAYTCLVLGIDFALRPSNLLRGDKRRVKGVLVRNPHTLMGAEVVFELDGPTGEEQIAASELRSKLGLPEGLYASASDVDGVSHCLFRILTTKTTTIVGSGETTMAGSRLRYLGRRTAKEESHLMVLACWCANCGIRDDEPVFSRIGPSPEHLQE
jgi:hypothetical protein